jgi:hypothetical protein
MLFGQLNNYDLLTVFFVGTVAIILELIIGIIGYRRKRALMDSFGPSDLPV